jgi:hypothetical protein
MKILFVIFTWMLFINAAQAQLKRTAVCPVFTVDVLYGKINDGLNSQSGTGEIKKTFPCFSELLETATGSKCAGIILR